MAEMQPISARQMRMQQNCIGCYYYSGWSCDYILMKKNRRPCPPGDDCTVRKKRGSSRDESLVVVQRTMNKLPPLPACNHNKKPYTVQVKHPRPVIKAKPNKKTVFNQTKKPSPKERSKPDPNPKAPSAWEKICEKLNTPEVIQMYEAGDSDATIGKAVGCCGNSVRKWRAETGRPCHNKRGPQSVQRRLENHLDDIRAALASGVTTTALSVRYGVHRDTILKFRKRHNF